MAVMAGRTKSSDDNDKTIFPLYVVFGRNRRLAVDTVEQITDLVIGQDDPQLALSSYDGNNAGLADVLADLRTLPFLSQRRLVVVRDADDFISNYRTELENYLQAPARSGVLLMTADSFPGNTRLAKLAKKIGKVFDCGLIKPRELPGYLADYARQNYKLSVSRDVVDLLIELAGDDSSVLLCEIDKIAAFVADPKEPKTRITQADVHALIGNNRQYNVFNVIDAMTGAKADLALTRLDQMLSQDKDAQYGAVGAFAWHFRRVYNARLMLDRGMSGRDVIRQLRIWANQDQFIRQAKQLSLKRISTALRALGKIDYAAKTGAGTVKTGLEKLILKFCLAE